MDGITTGVDSAVHQEYRPAGQVAAWTRAIKNESKEDLIQGIVDIVTTPAVDGLAGYAAGEVAGAAQAARAGPGLNPRPSPGGVNVRPAAGLVPERLLAPALEPMAMEYPNPLPPAPPIRVHT